MQTHHNHYDIHSIADDIYRATRNIRPKNFKTTRQKQIDFMWHLYGQGFTLREIGEIYDTSETAIFDCFKRRYLGTPTKRKYPV